MGTVASGHPGLYIPVHGFDIDGKCYNIFLLPEGKVSVYILAMHVQYNCKDASKQEAEGIFCIAG